MKRFVYDSYCYTDVLINKTKNYLTSTEIETYLDTERMYKNEDTILDNLKNLFTPSSKILDRLYLGNAYNSREYYDLKDNNIGLIVNCTSDINNYFEHTGEFLYHRVPVRDINGASIFEYIDKTINIIHEYLLENKDQNILIHCFMGSSRSASILAAYLIKFYGYNRRDAIGYIKEKRSIVNINVNFFKELGKFEGGLKP